MNYEQQICNIRRQTLAIIAEITKSPKPTYDLDGQSVAWTAYLKQLESTVTWCNRELAACRPCEIKTQAGT